MITINKDRLTAVFDLDGVLVTNPPEAMAGGPPITDKNFWDKHWKNPKEAPIQHDMLNLAFALTQAGWHIVFLTARPESYKIWTEDLLMRAGFALGQVVQLQMLPSVDVPQSSAAWKQETIKKWLAQGMRIQFMLEDYRPNAEAVRAVVPVLLYERKKPSQYLTNYPCCGGLARCWCPADTSP